MKNAGLHAKHVAVFGAGITGLTVAHECSEAGLLVTVYEKGDRVGGKAVSFRLPSDHRFAGAPVEHSIRAFQSSYFSLFETLKRIPHPDGGNVFGRIKALDGLLLTPGGTARAGHVRDRLLQTSTSLSSLAKLLNLYRSMRDWGISAGEFCSFLGMILDYVTSSDQRRRKTIGSQTNGVLPVPATSFVI